MPKKPVIEYDPVNNTYVDEEELQTKTDDEEWQDSYDMGYTPEDYEGEERAAFEDFIKRMGYEL